MLVFDRKYIANLHSIRDIHGDLRACLGHLGYSEIQQDPFMIGASEILANALKHADVSPSGFQVSLVIHGHRIVFTLKDDGSVFENFDLLRQTSEQQGEEMQEGRLETGGLGLYLTARQFDDFEYERMGVWNCYRLSTASPFSDQKPILLIIDDDAVARDLLALYVSEQYIVTHATSGESAIRFLKETPEKPDLILCDVVMREGNGVEFCQRLHEDKELALIPFIFMTGAPDNPVAQTAEDLPANDFLQKPVQKEGLLKIIKRTLHKAAQDQRILGDRLDKDVTAILAPSLPERIGDYHVGMAWQAAEAGGGDIALHLSGQGFDHIVMMDVMGHGAQAKFFSHSFAGYMQGFLAAQNNVRDPADILTALSQFLHDNSIGQKTIVTALILTVFDDGRMKIASAGHPPPLLLSEGGVRDIAIEGAMPGLSADISYESIDLALESNQRLVLYTDGVMEIGESAQDMQRHQDAMLDLIASSAVQSLDRQIEMVWAQCSTDHTKPQDDALLVMIQRD